MNTTPRSSAVQMIVFVLLVALGAGSRLVHIADNFAAVAAVALFAGWFFQSRMMAFAAPLAAMLLSDAFIGGYEWRLMIATYAALVLPVCIGRVLPERLSLARVLTASLAASVFFFGVSNFAVWAFAADGVYPRSFAGLVECYAHAVPFFKYTVAGDAVFCAVLFGAHELVSRRIEAKRVVAA